jgi:hypothetical protein
VSASSCEAPIDLIDRKGFGMELASDPVAELLVARMAGIVEGVEQVVVPPQSSGGQASWPSAQNGISGMWLRGQPLLQHNAVFPVIAKIVCVDHFGACSLKHCGERHQPLQHHPPAPL